MKVQYSAVLRYYSIYLHATSIQVTSPPLCMYACMCLSACPTLMKVLILGAIAAATVCVKPASAEMHFEERMERNRETGRRTFTKVQLHLGPRQALHLALHGALHSSHLHLPTACPLAHDDDLSPRAAAPGTLFSSCRLCFTTSPSLVPCCLSLTPSQTAYSWNVGPCWLLYFVKIVANTR